MKHFNLNKNSKVAGIDLALISTHLKAEKDSGVLIVMPFMTT